MVTTAAAGSSVIQIGGLSPLTTYYFRIRGFNGVGDSAYSNVISLATTNQAAILDFSQGFANSASTLTLNGTAALNGTQLQLVNGSQNQVGNAFSTSTVGISNFTTSFVFQLTSGPDTADGFTFAVQGNSPTAIVPGGGGLGYSGMDKSLAIKFDLYDNGGALAASVAAETEHEGPGPVLAGLAVFLVIWLHIPFDSLALSTLMTISGATNRTRHVANWLFALAVPLGAMLFLFGVKNAFHADQPIFGAALAFSAGTFLCIATSDLLPELQFHAHDRLKLSAALLLG